MVGLIANLWAAVARGLEEWKKKQATGKDRAYEGFETRQRNPFLFFSSLPRHGI